MTESDQHKEDEVLRRMLNTPPKPHVPKTGQTLSQKAKKP